MEPDVKEKFEKVETTLGEIKTVVGENLAYHKGLDLGGRMKKAEGQIEKKASWFGLYLASALLIAIATAAAAIVAVF